MSSFWYYNICIASLLSISYLGIYSFRLGKRRKNFKSIPGPKDNGFIGFYFGSLFRALKKIKEGTIYPEFVENCFNEYGPIFVIQLFDRFIINTIEPDIIKKCLIDKDIPKYDLLYNQIGSPLGQRLMGSGILTQTDNNLWKQRRHSIQPAFNKKYMEQLTSELDIIFNGFIQKLRNTVQNTSTLNLRPEINDIILESISTVFFGLQLNAQDKAQFQSNIKTALNGLIECFQDPFMKLKPHKWFYIYEFRKSVKFLRDFAKKQSVERLKLIQENEFVPNDLLTFILNSHLSTSQEINYENIVDDFVTFFIAGQETTVNALLFCFMELAKNPTVLKKLRTEIDQVVGFKSKIDHEDLHDLEYTGNVFKETLRKWSVVPSINRVLPYDIELNGYRIPKNTEISFSSYCVGRNPKYFSDPLEFKPERFEIDPVTKKSRIVPYSYFPFSLGPRNCLGQNFAKIEIKLLIAKIIQNFDIELCRNQPLEIMYTGNLKLKDDIKFCFKERT